MYRIVKNDTSRECKIVCGDYKTCTHVYSCICLDNTITFNMCKHIHSVCMYQMTDSNMPTNQENIPQEVTSSNHHDEVRYSR